MEDYTDKQQQKKYSLRNSVKEGNRNKTRENGVLKQKDFNGTDGESGFHTEKTLKKKE